MARRKTPIHEMNVVPYIDVMLVLLIIFMVTAPLVQTTQVELPKSTIAKIDTKEIKPIKVEMITTDNFKITYSDRKPLETKRSSINVTIVALIREEKINQPIIYFAARPNTLYGDVVEMADFLREIPDVKVSLLMEKK